MLLFVYRFYDLDEALQWLSENQDDLIQLTMVSNTYLNPLVLQQLRAAHKGIVEIRPEINDPNARSMNPQIDLNKSMEELFFDYFKREKNQEPNEDLKALFKEILAVNETIH